MPQRAEPYARQLRELTLDITLDDLEPNCFSPDTKCLVTASEFEQEMPGVA
jgi:hypothetical protein